MKKIFLFLTKLIVIGLLLTAIGLGILRLMFPPEKIKQIAIDYVQNTWHREVTFDSVSFNLIGFTLNNFALSEPESFSNGTFIKANQLEAKAAFFPLLKKRIEITSLSLDGIEIHIQKNKDGSFNFDSQNQTDTAQINSQPTSEQTTASASPLVLSAKRIIASDCDFYYQDLQTGSSSSIQDLNIRMENVTLDQPFPVQISFTGQLQEKNGPAVTIPVNIALNLFLAGLDMPKAYAEITNAIISYKKVNLTLQGKAENFKSPKVDLTGILSGLDQTAFIDFLPNLPQFTLPDLHLLLKAESDLDNNTAQISAAELRVLGSNLSTSGTLGWAGPSATYNFAGKLHADITQLVKMAQDTGFDPQGILKATFTATDKKGGKDVRATVDLKNVSALYSPFVLSQTNGTIKISSLDDISCSSLSGLLNGEKFTSSFAYRNMKDVLDLTLQLHIDKFILREFPSSSAKESSASAKEGTPSESSSTTQTLFNVKANVSVGEVNIPYFRTDGLSVQTELQHISESMQQTNGTVSFEIKPGAITDMENLLQQNKIARIILLPLGLLNKVGKKLNLNLFDAETQAKRGEIAITTAQGHYTFTDGVMHIDNTVFESPLTNINATGGINFVTNDLNMKASATLLTKQTPVIIKITGTLDNPSGKLDMLNTVGSVVGGILSYKTATSAASGVVNTSQKAATATAQETAVTAKQAIKALGGLFKKEKKEADPITSK